MSSNFRYTFLFKEAVRTSHLWKCRDKQVSIFLGFCLVQLYIYVPFTTKHSCAHRHREKTLAMLSSPSPLKTALAPEFFGWQNESSLALPSDMYLKSGSSGDQRVKEQVMMTVKRQKPKTSSSTMNYANRGKNAQSETKK